MPRDSEANLASPLVDRHYTPAWLAAEMVSYLPANASGTFADFTAGDGRLLAAAEARFGGVNAYLATDIDPRAIRKIRADHGTWRAGLIDIWSPRSRRASPLWGGEGHGADFVLLNPPFSYRGAAGHIFGEPSTRTRNSPAASAVQLVLREASRPCVIVALIPRSVLRSEKDREVVESWRHDAELEILSEYPRGTFEGVVANMSAVRLVSHGPHPKESADQPKHPSPPSQLAHPQWGRTPAIEDQDHLRVDVIRGRLQMHDKRISAVGEVPVVHTTDFKHLPVLSHNRFVPTDLGTAGPMVLIPRVGRLRSYPVVSWNEETLLALSDCVIAIRPRDAEVVGELRALLAEKYWELAAQSVSSCAPYVTVRQVVAWLASQGLVPSVAGRD